MSIRIHHGHRISRADLVEHYGDLYGFLAAVDQAVSAVRDRLDAILYADILAEVVDQGTGLTGEPLRTAALDTFNERVTDHTPGTVFHHPHSFDIDYSNDATTAGPEHLYLLVHSQRDDYTLAVRNLPGVVEYAYQTATDKPTHLTDAEWAERRSNWTFLIDAHRVHDVMSRYTHREDPTPTSGYVTHPQVILEHLPTTTARAHRLAQNQVAKENLATIDPADSYAAMNAVIRALDDPRVDELIPSVEASLTPITPDLLANT